MPRAKLLDFDENGRHTVDSALLDTTQRGGGAIVATPRLTTEALAIYKTRYLELTNDDTTDTHSLQITSVDLHEDIKSILGVMLAPTTAQRIYVYVRGDATEGYRFCINLTSGRISLESNTAFYGGAWAEVLGDNTTFTALEKYLIRCEMWGTDKAPYTCVFRYKKWLNSEPEPTTWLRSAAMDAEKVVPGGWFAIACYHATLTGKIAALNYINVRTNPLNLLTAPYDLSNAAWNKTNCTIGAGAVTSPDGSNYTNITTTNPTSSGASYVYQSAAITPSYTDDYVFSFYFKQNTSATIYLQCYVNAASGIGVAVVGYTFSTGAISNGSTGGVQPHARVVSIGSGWFRMIVRPARDHTGTGAFLTCLISGDGLTGTNAGTYLWGMMLEKGTYPSPLLREPPTPPVPLSNDSYYAWLETQPKLNVLGMLSYLGYDSSLADPKTVTRTEYIALRNFVSHEQDTPSNQPFTRAIKTVPSYDVRLGAGLTGPSTLGFGDLVVYNNNQKRVRRQNLFAYSRDMNNAVWTKNSVTTTANHTTGHDGRLKATRVLETAAVSTYHNLVQAIIGDVVPGRYYRLTCKIKANGRTKFQLGTYTTAPWVGTTYQIGQGDLATKTFSVAVGTPTVAIQELDERWFLLTMTFKCAVAATNPQMYFRFLDAAGADLYTGDITKGMWVDEFQFSEATADNVFVDTLTYACDETTMPRYGGERDSWIRRRWLKTPYARILVGPPGAPLSDHRDLMVVAPQQPTAADATSIRFPLKDIITDLLAKPITTTRYGASTTLEGEYLPQLFGQVAAVELQSQSGLTYRITEGPLAPLSTGAGRFTMIYENGVPLRFTSTITAVSAGSDYIEFTPDHGLSVNAIVVFNSGTPPAGLALNQVYYVKSVPTAKRVTLCNTPGGATVDITGATTGANAFCGNFYYPNDGADGTVVLLANPVAGSRLIAGGVSFDMAQGPRSGQASTAKAGGVLADILFRAGGLSVNYKNSVALAALDTRVALEVADNCSGIYTLGGVSVREVADKYAVGSNLWYGPGPNGIISCGFVEMPTTSVMTFTERDVKPDSMRLVRVLPAINIEESKITWAPWYLRNGPLPDLGYGVYTPESVYDYSGFYTGVPPLDGNPQLADSSETSLIALLYLSVSSVATEIANFRKMPLGVFECDVRIKASRLERFSGVTFEHRSGDWISWGPTNPASYDNYQTANGGIAAVIGAAPNITSKSVFNVKLTVLKPLYGNYPGD